ncbi:MAG: beta-galactosidase, partial [Armatimonadota bacterium]|nr:beta-galactosidase [Armatimonadota bacterium]
MTKIAKFALCAALLLVLCLPRAQAADTSARQRLLFDSGWRFYRGELPGSPAVSGIPVTQWRWKADDAGEADAVQMAGAALDTSGADWKDAAVGQDVFGGRQGFAWFRATLPRLKSVAGLHLHFEGVDDNATVYLDGQRVFHHEGWDEAFDVPLTKDVKPSDLPLI